MKIDPRRNPLPWAVAVLGIATLSLAAFRFVNGRKTGPRHEEQTNSTGMRFVLVPPGHFVMGSPTSEEGRGADEHQHAVEITRPFYLGVHEVTQGQYERVMGENPSFFTAANGHGGPSHPVENVSWNEAVEFCRRLSELPAERAAGRSYRLPTEAEWEYACRAGSEKAYASGDVLPPNAARFSRGRAANAVRLSRDRFARTAPVGAYPDNDWGLFAMHGNVWEWCADRYGKDYYRHSPPADPQGPSSGEKYVARGGSRSDPAAECRCANRLALSPGIRLGNGFRVVMVANGKSRRP